MKRYTRKEVTTLFLRYIYLYGKVTHDDIWTPNSWCLCYNRSFGGYKIVEYSKDNGEYNIFGMERRNGKLMCEWMQGGIDVMIQLLNERRME